MCYLAQRDERPSITQRMNESYIEFAIALSIPVGYLPILDCTFKMQRNVKHIFDHIMHANQMT